MSEINASLYMLKGLICDAPDEVRQQIIYVYNRLVDALTGSDRVIEDKGSAALALSLVSLIIAGENFDGKLHKLDENLQPIKIGE